MEYYSTKIKDLGNVKRFIRRSFTALSLNYESVRIFLTYV